MFVYKMNLLKEFEKIGWTGYTLQRNRDETGKIPFGSSQVHYMRNGKMIGITSLETACRLLNKQPGDLIEYIPDDRYIALKKSGYFEEKGIPTPPLEESTDGK